MQREGFTVFAIQSKYLVQITDLPLRVRSHDGDHGPFFFFFAIDKIVLVNSSQTLGL